ncbi:MAG: Rieske 2Fe-2S domain-containing protein [Actinobacteria bacterium]|nr:Rieske 2Fe-2S domain-containing protein [Actinomycetota bacterium]
MTTPSLDRPPAGSRSYPYDCWYLAARSDHIDQTLTALRITGRAVVLTRGSDGAVAALADRGAHRPYPLSLGRRVGDRIVSGLDGWTYTLDGQCVHVPSQTLIPVDARVRTYPVIDDGVFVWIWTGDPRLAERRRPPALDWLHDSAWTGAGGELTVAANHVFLLEMFADVTHVPFVAPAVAPPVLSSGPTPPLEVEITETSVSFVRRYPSATLPDWHSAAAGLPAGAPCPHREFGTLASPAVWTDDWEVQDGGTRYRLRFVQAVTPIDERTSLLTWRVSRDFNLADPAVTDTLTEEFAGYYPRVAAACEVMQRTVDRDGPGIDVDVSADVAALHVRRILRNLVREETGRAAPRRLRERPTPVH